MRSVFHLAFHVRDLDVARAFYCGTLGCREGRSAPTWVDVDFFGHELSLHLGEPFPTSNTGKVGDILVPMPHLGVILPLKDWQGAKARLAAANVDFVIKPQVRFKGEPGEQYTMLFTDPFRNPIEIKGFADMAKVFAA